MTRIELNAEEARGVAGQVTTAANTAQDDFDELKTVLTELGESFKGQSATAWQDKYDEWATSAKELVDSLESLGKFLNNAADSIEKTDSDLAGQLKG